MCTCSLQVPKECREDRESNAEAEKDSFCHPNILSRLQRTCTFGIEFDVAIQEGIREDSLINKTFESAIFVETHLQHIQLISQMNDHAPQSETRSLLPAVAMVQHCDVAMRKMPECNSAFSGTPDMIHVVDMLQLPHCENEFKNCN